MSGARGQNLGSVALRATEPKFWGKNHFKITLGTIIIDFGDSHLGRYLLTKTVFFSGQNIAKTLSKTCCTGGGGSVIIAGGIL